MRSAECLAGTADDYQTLWMTECPDLPWDGLKALMINIITEYPRVIAVAIDPKVASDILLAIDPQTAPPGMDLLQVTGIINAGLAYIRARCPEESGIQSV